MTSSRKHTLTTILIVLIVIAGLGAWFAWYEFFREVPEAEWAEDKENKHSAEDIRFMYGSIGGEHDAGIPYWFVYVLPRIFPDKLPGPGAYASFGMAWDQGKDLPIGFTTKVIGFKRVAQNCAVCHTTSFRTKPNELPKFIPTGPAHTFNLEAFFRFLVDCANDPRFNADTLMNEINQSKPKDFTFVDGLIYRYILIPVTRDRLRERKTRFAWIYRHIPPEQWPDWGRGRDDAMNLTKYFLTSTPKMDDTLGPTDMPSIWNLQKYSLGPKVNDPRCGKDALPTDRMNFAGDSCNARSVIIDSALGLLGAAPSSNQIFLNEIDWLESYLRNHPPPKYADYYADSYPIDQKKAAEGKPLFHMYCGHCHDRRDTTGTVMSLDNDTDPVTHKKLGTDPARVESWNADAAIRANNFVKAFGIDRPGLVQANPTGYIRAFMDGIWLRAPYLHNGSVPTLRDLLKPPAERPITFYRGYDVYDPCDAGFVSTEDQANRLEDETNHPDQPKCRHDHKATEHFWWKEALRVTTPYVVRTPTPCKPGVPGPCYVEIRSNSNGGHDFGTALRPDQKDALLEYLKTL
jgi:mono/diheme cytochrome c family protein